MNRTLRLLLGGAAIALAFALGPPGIPTQVMAAVPICDVDVPDLSDECRTTQLDDCMELIGESVTIQIGGFGAEDSNGDGGTCEGTNATALIMFTKLSASELEIKAQNTTCGDNSVLTAIFWNITQTVTSMLLSPGYPMAVSPDTVDEPWNLGYSQTTTTNDQLGFQGLGFGHFDATLFNGSNPSPNGGTPTEILPGETLIFKIQNIVGGYNLCDFLTIWSTPPPGERNRTAVGRYQACGPDNQNSAMIGPCSEDPQLLAVISSFRLTPEDNRMGVNWRTSLEIDNAGFNVLRRAATRGGWQRVTEELIPGQGDSVTGAEYGFVDETALNGVEYMYRIEDIEFSGRIGMSEINNAVANPPNPQVRLTKPAYGATVDLSERPRFGFAGNGHGSVIMQISSDATFEDSNTVSTRVPRRFGSSEFTLPPRTSRLAARLAVESDGIVYWRLVGRDHVPLSETFRLGVN